MIGYSYSYFDGDNENGVFTSRYLMSLGSTTISWRSCKQHVPMNSIIEIEYVVATKETKELVWLKNIL